MHVALLCLDPAMPLGGTQAQAVHFRGVAAALLRGGHQVSALVANPGGGPEADPLRNAGLAISPIEANMPARLLAVRLGRGRPDLVLERLALGAQTGSQAASALDVPHVYEADQPLEPGGGSNGSSDGAEQVEHLREGFSNSQGAVALSDEAARWVKDLAPAGYPVRVVPNGVDPAFFASPDPTEVGRVSKSFGGGAAFRVGFFGSLRPWHDWQVLIEAMEILRKRLRTQLVLVGDGPQRNEVLREAWNRGVALHLAGTVSHTQIPTYLAACDAVAVPYSASKLILSPLKLVEAMAAGKAVVASAIGPCTRMVRPGDNGLLVAPGHAGALASALEIFARDPGLRDRLGAAARRSVERHRWDDVTTSVLAFAREVAVKESA
jgi:glycosyltransferase involved in cell wall biosynthesis